MIDQETLERVIRYIKEHSDSEVEVEIEYALRWVLFGKANQDTPIIIRSALEAN